MSKYDSRSMNTNESGKVDVGSLLREGVNDQQALAKLREQYPNDKELVNKMFTEWEEQNNRIRRKAKKFAELILTRYNHLGPKRIMEKAKKLKKKYNFSEDEFQAFVNIALSDKALSAINVYNTPNTPMSKTLGQLDATMVKMNVKANEMDVLQEILRMHQDNSALHTQVVLQSLTYQDCENGAIAGRYDANFNNVLTHVHPVVAALFLPRIKYLDEHMLIGSISSIVASRHQNASIKDRPTWELYWDIITDPNEMACVNNKDSSLIDLRNRAKLQVELWKSVQNLRQGKYYAPEVAGFVPAVDQCRNYVFDSADYMMVKDEGTILRRLLGAFSLRPTIVSFSPLHSAQSLNYPLNSMAVTQITTIPIVNLRIPYNVRNSTSSVHINEALEQPDYYVENKMIVAKVKSVMYSRDVIFFYVNRRFQNMNYVKLTAPYVFQNLPITTSGFETLNEVPVYFDPTLPIGDDQFRFRSVVMVQRANLIHNDYRGTNQDLIIGCITGVVVPPMEGRNETTTAIIYDPLSAKDRSVSDPTTNHQPISIVPTDALNTDRQDTLEARAFATGTIFVYVKQNFPMF